MTERDHEKVFILAVCMVDFFRATFMKDQARANRTLSQVERILDIDPTFLSRLAEEELRMFSILENSV